MPCRPPLFARSSSRLLLLLLTLAAVSALPARSIGGPDASGGKVAVPKDVAELRAMEEQVKLVVAKVLPCNVAVRIGSSQGSGVLVSKDGYVLTAGHVVGKPGQEASFIFQDGKTVKGKTLGLYKGADAGMMKITDEGEWPFVELGESADLEPGTWCVAVGHPLGYQPGRPPVVRIGRVLRSQETVIQTDCPLVAGDSGGPLFDLEGRLIGINSRIGGSMSMNFHVPVDVFQEHWDRLAKGESIELELPGKDSSEVKDVFRQVVAEAGPCVARVKCDGKDVALGTIVGPDGWILTKASELKGSIVCRLKDGRELEARLVGVNQPFDLAMLKVETDRLPTIRWSDQNEFSVGELVAAPGLEDGPPLALGIVGAPLRKIPAEGGILGVGVADAEGGAKVVRILPNTAAQKAGIKVDDVITHVNGKPTRSQTEVIAAIKRHRPGCTVKLKLKRGDKELEISAKLSKIDTPATRKRELQNRSGVGISKRHDDFPTVLQHDTVIRPADCGGPLVDLTGKVIGINVARGGRTETYAVPTDVLLPLMYDLMSGRLPPPEPKPAAEKKPEPANEPKPEAEKPPEAEQKPAEKQPEGEQKPANEPKPEGEQKPANEPEPEPEKQPEPEEKPADEPKPEAEKQPDAE